MRSVRRSIVPVLAAGLLGLSCGGSGGGGNDGGPTGPGGGELPDGDVTLNSTTFQPQDLTVSTGSTVVWVNAMTITHSITPDGQTQWNRVQLNQRGQTFSVTFEQPGTYEYYCEFHGAPGVGMHGTITVADGESGGQSGEPGGGPTGPTGPPY